MFAAFRHSIEKSFNNIRNEKLRHHLLQAVPFWLASLLTGGIAVLYAKTFQYGEALMYYLLDGRPWAIFILAPVCFVLSWWVVKRFAPYAKGSGIPQVMAAVELANPKEYRKIRWLLSLKIILIKIVSSTILVIGGGAVGREGPTIQVAGSVFRLVNRFLPASWPRISKRNMIMTGAAAGLSAAFNTPLGGIVFAVEELSKIHMNYFKTALFTAVIIAGLTAQTVAGSYLYLGYPKTQGVDITIVFPVIIVAAVSGIAASQLSRLMLYINQMKKALKSDWANLVFLLASAFTVAAVAFILNDAILGSGKHIMEKILFSDAKNVAWYVPLIRMLGSAIAFTSGGAGGIFAPSLTAGATIGSVFSGWIHLEANETNVVVLAGMVAFLTGITRAPFTSSIIVLEMTDRHSLIFYLMLSGMVSLLLSAVVSRSSLYDELKKAYLDEIRR